jgi:hypothetical protein
MSRSAGNSFGYISRYRKGRYVQQIQDARPFSGVTTRGTLDQIAAISEATTKRITTDQAARASSSLD